MRLIDADELLTAFPVDDEPMLTKSSVRMTIKRMPSVDAVEVVRCEQCKHYNNIDFHCYYHGSMCFKPNDYCPYGEVRDDE